MSYFDPKTKNWDDNKTELLLKLLCHGSRGFHADSENLLSAPSENFVWFDTKDVQQQINKGRLLKVSLQ